MKFINRLLIVVLLAGFFACNSERPNYTIFLAGDSTMAWKPHNKRPETGWGMLFQNCFNDNVKIDNRAQNGMSTHSFQIDGLWEKLIKDVKPGDFVFIQFGHNDYRIDRKDRYASPVQYRANLSKFIDDVESKGATPVLLTSIVRRNFDKDAIFKSTHGVYPDIMREVAEDKDVVLLELNLESRKWIEKLGKDKSKEFYLIAEPGVWENYPKGINDNTHLNERGAAEIVNMVVGEIKNSSLDIKNDLK